MLGSAFFGISAVTSFIAPATGEVLDAEATNATTFLGVACFLIGAFAVPWGGSASAASPHLAEAGPPGSGDRDRRAGDPLRPWHAEAGMSRCIGAERVGSRR